MNSIQKQHEDFCKVFKPEFGTIFNIDSVQFEPLEDKYYQDAQRLNWAFAGWLQAAKAQAVPEWIETAIQPPEEGQKVIISGIYGVGIAEFSYLYKDEFVMYDMGVSNPILSKDQVKFWQPLPDAPQEPAND